MTTTANRTVAPFGAISAFRLVSAVESIALAAGRAWRAAQTRRALERLSAHELADIGLTEVSRSNGGLDAFAQALVARRG